MACWKNVVDWAQKEGSPASLNNAFQVIQTTQADCLSLQNLANSISKGGCTGLGCLAGTEILIICSEPAKTFQDQGQAQQGCTMV
jgi:hypothetical protein